MGNSKKAASERANPDGTCRVSNITFSVYESRRNDVYGRFVILGTDQLRTIAIIRYPTLSLTEREIEKKS